MSTVRYGIYIYAVHERILDKLPAKITVLTSYIYTHVYIQYVYIYIYGSGQP